MKIRTVLGSVLVLALGLSAHASSITKADLAAHGIHSKAELAKYMKIGKVRIQEVAVDQSKFAPFAVMIPALGDLVAPLATSGLPGLATSVLASASGVGDWIAIGQKVWAIVVANKPVVHVSTAHVSVLPVEKNLWSQMSGWQAPIARSFTITATNLMGMDVVSQTYTVTYQYGGRLNGKGYYLANATIIPANITVAWGYSLDSSVEVGQVLNTNTADNPVPSVELQLKRSIKTVLKQDDATSTFYITGTGALKTL